MYQTLTFFHSFVRWAVLASLLWAIFRAYRGYFLKATFTKTDNAVRHWTATIAHIQLLIGMVLYFQSPIVKYFFSDAKSGTENFEITFFALVHSMLMLTAIVLITLGSAKAKRCTTDLEKFKTMLFWFLAALLVILVAIPWPFSPFAQRPYFR